MSNTIDHRIVELTFDNAQFEAGVKNTIKTLGDLNTSLQLEGISAGIEGIASKLTAIGAAGFTAVQEITKGIIGVGKNIADSIASPIIRGGKKRALAIEQAKFQFKGLGMDVKATMESARQAVLGTSYGLDEAATAAAMFGASGLRAGEEMTSALRGISGVAAMAGSSYGEIADVFTKVAGQGRLMGDDLNRLASRGINAAATLGKAMGKTETQIREMVTDGKISFKEFAAAMDDAFGKHATSASKTFEGASANLRAAFARIGANFFTPWHEGLRRIIIGVTKVVDSIKDALYPVMKYLGIEWKHFGKNLRIFIEETDYLYGKDKQAKALTIAMEGIVNVLKAGKSIATQFGAAYREVFPRKSHDYLVVLAERFREFTKTLKPSKEELLEFKETIKGFFLVLKSLGDSFKNVFTPDTKKDISETKESFVDFLKKLQPTKKFLEGLQAIFESLFGVIKVIGIAFKSAFQIIGAFISGLFGSTTDVTSFSTAIFDAVKSFAEWIKSIGEMMSTGKDFKANLEDVTQLARDMGAALGGLFTGIKNFVTGVGDSLSDSFQTMLDKGASVSDMFKSLKDRIKDAFSSDPVDTDGITTLGDKLKEALSKVDWNKVFVVMFSALNIVGVIQIVRFIQDIVDRIVSIAETTIKPLEALTNVLGTMEKEINSRAIKNIAIAVALLVGSLLVLSLIDAARLWESMGALVLLIGALGAITLGFSKIDSTQLTGLMGTSTALIALAGAILILSFAVSILGKMDPEQLTQGLYAVGAVLAGLITFTMALPPGQTQGAAAALMALSISILILTKAISILGSMDPNVLIQGAFAIAGFLVGLGMFVRFTESADLSKTATSLVAVGLALLAFAYAVKIISDIEEKAFQRAAAAVAVFLFAIVEFVQKTHEADLAASAAGLIAVGIAMLLFAAALKVIGSLEPLNLALALGTLIVMLFTLVAVIAVLSKIDPGGVGAGSLLVLSIALVAMAVALGLIGSMPWKAIVKGLVGIAGVLIILGLAGAALLYSGAIIGLVLLAAALIGIASAIFIAGAGIMLFSLGIMYLASALSTGGEVILQFIMRFIELLPEMARGLLEALDVFLTGMIALVPKIVLLVTMLMTGFITGLILAIPLIIDTLGKMITPILESINEWMPEFIDAAGELIANFIHGLADQVDPIADAGTDLIIELIDAMADESEEMITAAMDATLRFIEGLNEALTYYGPRITSAAEALMRSFARELGYALGRINLYTLGASFIEGIVAGIRGETRQLPAPMREAVNVSWNAARAESQTNSPSKLFMPLGSGFIEGMIVGIKKATPQLAGASKKMVHVAHSAIKLAADKTLDVFSGIEEPTIKPVVDLDNVYKGAKAISDAMSSTPAVAFAADINSRQNGSKSTTSDNTSTSTSNETTFIQNNYSPKPLSRLELYRQTRNLLLVTKGPGG